MDPYSKASTPKPLSDSVSLSSEKMPARAPVTTKRKASNPLPSSEGMVGKKRKSGTFGIVEYENKPYIAESMGNECKLYRSNRGTFIPIMFNSKGMVKTARCDEGEAWPLMVPKQLVKVIVSFDHSLSRGKPTFDFYQKISENNVKLN